jgi:uncharacterized membrane protein YgcG
MAKGGIMKRALLGAAVLSVAFALPAFAVEGGQPPKEPAANFEQKKAEILDNFDKRISRLQEEKACVQAAKDMKDLGACREKFMPEKMRERLEKRRPGGQGGEGGQGGPGGPGGQRGEGGQGGPGGVAPAAPK